MEPNETGIVTAKKISIPGQEMNHPAFTILPDPQTNGGILFSVRESGLETIKSLLSANGLSEFSEPIGRMVNQENHVIEVVD